jgi:hypothetical protein
MEINSLLEQYYGGDKVIQVGNRNIFRCLKVTESNVPYEIDYVDATGDWLDADFLSKMESEIGVDFFRNDGFLQWNYYYYILSDPNVIKAHRRLKQEIENDTFYARKEVISSAQFEDRLRSHLRPMPVRSGAKVDSSRTSDLYDRWVEELHNMG